MGFIRKALYIATFGLSGLVFKETPSPQRTEKPAVKQMRAQTQAKATRALRRRILVTPFHAAAVAVFELRCAAVRTPGRIVVEETADAATTVFVVTGH